MRLSAVAAASALALLAVVAGCAPPADEDTSEDEGALRADPSSVVPTFAPSLHVLDGYNSLLDRATSRCVEPTAALAAEVGAPAHDVRFKAIRTTAELAKELEVDLSAASNVPTVEASGAVKLVKTFKESSSKVTFVLRSVSSYQVINRTPLKLSAEAKTLAAGTPARFLLGCGGSYAAGVRYEAEVMAILQFEASSTEEAQKIETSVSGAAPGSAVKMSTGFNTSVATNARNHAFTSQIVFTGFSGSAAMVTDDPDVALKTFDTLNQQMTTSLAADASADEASYFTNPRRNARPVSVAQQSYAAVSGAPAPETFQDITSVLKKAELFYTGVAGYRARLESVKVNHLEKFFADTKNQFRYNVAGEPLISTKNIVVAARDWSTKLETALEKVNVEADACLERASNGDYGSCRTTPASTAATASAASFLASYSRTGRIVELAAFAPNVDNGELPLVSYRYATPSCQKENMRLPTTNEMWLLAPLVSALGQGREIWVAPTPTCAKPVMRVVGDTRADVYCDRDGSEPLPYVNDRAVICVASAGPAAAGAALGTRHAEPGLGRPDLAGLARHVPHGHLAVLNVEHAEHDGQVEAARSDRAGIEDREIAIATDERHVRVPTHDELAVLRARQPRGVGPQLRSIDRDVDHQDLEELFVAVAHLEREDVGEVVGVLVDVAAHHRHGRDLAEPTQHVEIADVAGVQDAVRLQRRDDRCRARVRLAVGIGHHHEAQRAIGERDSLVLRLDPPGHGDSVRQAGASCFFTSPCWRMWRHSRSPKTNMAMHIHCAGVRYP